VASALGYCWPQSVVAGEPVVLHASAGASIDVEVVRDGAEPEVVHRERDVEVDHHAIGADAPEQGCRWPAALTIATDPTWRSGLYLVRLNNELPTAWFVVRSPQPASSNDEGRHGAALRTLDMGHHACALSRRQRTRSGAAAG